MSYECRDSFCEGIVLQHLEEVIEHVRGFHTLHRIQRPGALGQPDSHGHVWYCSRCGNAMGKDHRSFNSDSAMWQHLQTHDDLDVGKIKPERTWTDVYATPNNYCANDCRPTTQLEQPRTTHTVARENTMPLVDVKGSRPRGHGV